MNDYFYTWGYLFGKNNGNDTYPVEKINIDMKEMVDFVLKSDFKRKKITYLGCITEKITPKKELYVSGYNEDGAIVFGFDSNGKLYAETYN